MPYAFTRGLSRFTTPTTSSVTRIGTASSLRPVAPGYERYSGSSRTSLISDGCPVRYTRPVTEPSNGTVHSPAITAPTSSPDPQR